MPKQGRAVSGLEATALWSSGFRPFYLAGVVWGLFAIACWALGHFGGWTGWAGLLSQPMWHGHEMIYGFAGALSGGFVLTALPSWAGTPAIAGRPLALLVAAWAIGRVAIMAQALPPFWAGTPAAGAVADLLYLPLLAAIIWPGVWAAKNRLYRLLLVILAILFAGNLAFHLGAVKLGIRLGFYGLMLLFSFVGGLLTPIFTETASGRGPIGHSLAVEVVAVVSLVAVAVADLAGLPAVVIAAAALSAALVHAVRMAPWRTRTALGSPLVLAMHLGYAWLVVSFCLLATSALGMGPAASAAVHAFTLGALGLTKLSLMTRVALKHTGRPLSVRPMMVGGYGCMGVAALARVAAEAGLWPTPLMALSTLAWLSALVIYLIAYGRFLIRPSLPRSARQ